MQFSRESGSEQFWLHGSGILHSQADASSGNSESLQEAHQQLERYDETGGAASEDDPLTRIEQYIANWMAEESLASSQVKTCWLLG